MLTQSQLSRLKYQHHTIEELTGDLDESFLRKKVDPGKWSAFENIVHLVAYQPAFISRIEKILTEGTPSFERYKAENDPLFYLYLDKSFADIIYILHNDRLNICNLLESMNAQQLRRTGLHLKYGNLSITKWTEFFLLHESHHLFTIFMIVQEHRGTVRV